MPTHVCARTGEHSGMDHEKRKLLDALVKKHEEKYRNAGFWLKVWLRLESFYLGALARNSGTASTA
jgi:hypothetical protein